MKSEKTNAIERAKVILSSIPANEKIDIGDFLAAVALFLDGQMKQRGKTKDAAKGYKYKTAFVDPATGKKRRLRFKLKDGEITIKLKQTKKKN